MGIDEGAAAEVAVVSEAAGVVSEAAATTASGTAVAADMTTAAGEHFGNVGRTGQPPPPPPPHTATWSHAHTHMHPGGLGFRGSSNNRFGGNRSGSRYDNGSRRASWKHRQDRASPSFTPFPPQTKKDLCHSCCRSAFAG